MNTECMLQSLNNMRQEMLQINAEDTQLLIVFRDRVQQDLKSGINALYVSHIEEKNKLEKQLAQAEMKRHVLEMKLKQAQALIDHEKAAISHTTREKNHLQKKFDDILHILPENERHQLLSQLPPITNDSLCSTSDIHFTTDTTASSETDSEEWHLMPHRNAKMRSTPCEERSCISEDFISANQDNDVENDQSGLRVTANQNRAIGIDLRSARATANENSALDSVQSSIRVSGDVIRQSADSTTYLSDSNRSAIFYSSIMENLKTRPHKFRVKTFVLGEKCVVCRRKISCGAQALLCDDCSCVTHKFCENYAPKPCISMKRIKKNSIPSIQDYCPQFRPYVPAIVVHCVLEIEERGLGEEGLYKVPSFSRSIEELKKEFLANRGVPNLSKVDVKSICGLLKDFFQSLRPRLISSEMFNNLLNNFDQNSSQPLTYTIIFDAVRCVDPASTDTLAFLILHLQNVVQSTACGMTARGLSKIFTPLLVDNYVKECYKKETRKWSLIEKLIKVSADVWKCIILKDL